MSKRKAESVSQTSNGPPPLLAKRKCLLTAVHLASKYKPVKSNTSGTKFCCCCRVVSEELANNFNFLKGNHKNCLEWSFYQLFCLASLVFCFFRRVLSLSSGLLQISTSYIFLFFFFVSFQLLLLLLVVVQKMYVILMSMVINRRMQQKHSFDNFALKFYTSRHRLIVCEDMQTSGQEYPVEYIKQTIGPTAIQTKSQTIEQS